MGLENTMTVPEVADLLKVSARTIRAYITQGKLSAYKFGSTYHITESSVEALIQKNFISKGENENV